MGQSGTRQAGAGADVLSGPPSGEREDPEGKMIGHMIIHYGDQPFKVVFHFKEPGQIND